MSTDYIEVIIKEFLTKVESEDGITPHVKRRLNELADKNTLSDQEALQAIYSGGQSGHGQT